VADWIRAVDRVADGWMRWAWGLLTLTGLGLGIGLPLAMQQFAPGGEWLGLVGLVPIAGGIAAWAGQSLHSRRAAAISWAATACGTVAIIVAAGPGACGHAGGTRHLLRRLPADGIDQPIVTYRAPASATFYAGLVTRDATVVALEDPDEVAAFVQDHPETPVVIDSRWEKLVTARLPAHYALLRAVTVLPESRGLVLWGPTEPSPGPRLADTPEPSPRR